MTSANYENIANELLKRSDFLNELPSEIESDAADINADLADCYLELSIMLKDEKDVIEFTDKDKQQTQKALVALHAEMLEELRKLSNLGFSKPEWIAFHESGLTETYFKK